MSFQVTKNKVIKLFRAFKILIGSSGDQPTSFGTTQVMLSPGKEHFVQINPTVIR